MTKAHILAYSRPLLGPPTEKTARLLTRTLVDLKSLIIGGSGSSEHPIEPYGYCSQMAMNEQGVAALLTANISKCVASHLSDNSDHYPSIVEKEEEEDTDSLFTTVEMLIARPEFIRVALQLK